MSIWKKIRMENGVTQTEMANKIGIAHSTLSSFENGRRKMPSKYWKYYFELDKEKYKEILKVLKEMGY